MTQQAGQAIINRIQTVVFISFLVSLALAAVADRWKTGFKCAPVGAGIAFVALIVLTAIDGLGGPLFYPVVIIEGAVIGFIIGTLYSIICALYSFIRPKK